MEEGHGGHGKKPSGRQGTLPIVGSTLTCFLCKSATRSEQQQGSNDLSRHLASLVCMCRFEMFQLKLHKRQYDCQLWKEMRKCSNSTLPSWGTSSTNGWEKFSKYSTLWWFTVQMLACTWI